MRTILWLFLLLPFALSSCGGSGNASSASGTPANGVTITTESPAIKASVMAADSCGTEIIEVGFGAGTETPATDTEVVVPPDFIVNKTWLTTPWGVETYKFGLNEVFDTKAQSKNIGIGTCPLNSEESTTITGHFYLSNGYKEDVHSGDGAWRRIDSTTTQCDNLKPGDTHTETKNTVIRE